MELDELKATWKAMDARVEKLEREQSLARGKGVRRRLMVEPIYETVVALMAAVWSGGFLWENMAKIQSMPVGAAPGLVVYGLAVYTMWLGVRQLVWIGEMDFAGPVVEAQKRVAAVRGLRVRSTRFMLLAGFGLWWVVPLFALQAVGRYEVIFAVNAGWMAANVGLGLAAGLGVWIAAKRMGERSVFWGKVEDALAGTAVMRAERAIGEVEAFGRGA